jgi:hypothetical protein
MEIFRGVVTKQFTINYFYIWEISSTPSFIQTQITILEIWIVYKSGRVFEQVSVF